MCLALKKPYNPIIALSTLACSISAGLSLNEIWFQAMPPPLLIPRDDTLFYSLRVLGGSACYLSSSLGFVELIWFAKKKEREIRGSVACLYQNFRDHPSQTETDRHEKIGVFVSQSTWFLKKSHLSIHLRTTEKHAVWAYPKTFSFSATRVFPNEALFICFLNDLYSLTVVPKGKKGFVLWLQSHRSERSKHLAFQKKSRKKEINK